MSNHCPAHMESLVDTAVQLKTGEITSTILTQRILSRIKSHNSYYKAYVQVFESEALKDAAIADKAIGAGYYKGALHGIPIAVKDLFHIAGTNTEAGSKIRKGQVSKVTATVVEKLREAGAIIIGKLTMTEFALSGYHPECDVPINPWNQSFWSGVSSSGSAVAVSAGLAYASIGTDTGGSIRFPACVNGVVGIKPTFGSVSSHGSIPLAQTLDHIGPFSRRVEDAAIVLQAIAGPDVKDPFSTDKSNVDYLSSLKDGAQGLKIGVDESYLAAPGVHPDVTRSVREAIKVLLSEGAEIINIKVADVAAMSEVWAGVVAYEAAKNHADTYPKRAGEYGPVFKNLLEVGSVLLPEAYAVMQETVKQAKNVVEKALSDVDMIICPASPLPTGETKMLGPQSLMPPEIVAFAMMFTAPFNFTGSPCVTMPCGYDSENNMPLGLQFVGHHFGESKLLQAAYAYEQQTKWHKDFPPNPILLRRN